MGLPTLLHQPKDPIQVGHLPLNVHGAALAAAPLAVISGGTSLKGKWSLSSSYGGS